MTSATAPMHAAGGLGFVWLVGAGPGDPELITVRGARLLATADAIVHDRLVPAELLELAGPGASRYDVGKEGHRPGTPQRLTTELLISLARSGLRVVRLKGGDPFVFGRGGEEALALREAGIPFGVVPGVTAGVAGPAHAGIPVTHRELASSVAFVTASSARQRDRIDWTALARIDTVVVFMAGRAAAAVARKLLDAGRDRSTPAAIVIAASRPDQEVHVTDLGSLATVGLGTVTETLARRPVLLVVGQVAALADELAWVDPAADGPDEAGVDGWRALDQRETLPVAV